MHLDFMGSKQQVSAQPARPALCPFHPTPSPPPGTLPLLPVLNTLSPLSSAERWFDSKSEAFHTGLQRSSETSGDDIPAVRFLWYSCCKVSRTGRQLSPGGWATCWSLSVGNSLGKVFSLLCLFQTNGTPSHSAAIVALPGTGNLEDLQISAQKAVLSKPVLQEKKITENWKFAEWKAKIKNEVDFLVLPNQTSLFSCLLTAFGINAIHGRHPYFDICKCLSVSISGSSDLFPKALGSFATFHRIIILASKCPILGFVKCGLMSHLPQNCMTKMWCAGCPPRPAELELLDVRLHSLPWTG